MHLLLAKLCAQIPPLYSQGHQRDPTVYAKLFCPWSDQVWFVTECSRYKGTFLLFGYVTAPVEEWKFFALSDLESLRGPGILTVECDCNFRPKPFSRVIR
jgi:hypothetical protein